MAISLSMTLKKRTLYSEPRSSIIVISIFFSWDVHNAGQFTKLFLCTTSIPILTLSFLPPLLLLNLDLADLLYQDLSWRLTKINVLNKLKKAELLFTVAYCLLTVAYCLHIVAGL